MKLDPKKISAALSALAADATTVRESGPVHRSFAITVKAGSFDEKKRSVRVIASTAAIDSYDEIVEQSWRLKRYLANPVVLYGHNRVGFLGMGGDPKDTLPIGHASDVGVVDGQLEATLHFVNEKANPMGELVWQGFLQESIRTVSVGFMPHSVREEKHDDKDIYVLADNELYEISAVPIPANPEAVALSAERTAERAWLKERAHPTFAARAAQETTDMLTPEQIKKLQDDLAAKSIECDTLSAQCVTLKAQAATATSELGAVNDALTKLEPATDAFKGLDALAKVGVLAKSIDGAKAKAIEAEVDALVGKKLLPAQKADFVALRTNSPDSFANIVKGLADLPLTKVSTPPEASPTKSKADGSLGKSKIASKGKALGETARASES